MFFMKLFFEVVTIAINRTCSIQCKCCRVLIEKKSIGKMYAVVCIFFMMMGRPSSYIVTVVPGTVVST